MNGIADRPPPPRREQLEVVLRKPHELVHRRGSAQASSMSWSHCAVTTAGL